MMDLFTAMNERQSCRNFLDNPVDRADIEKILEAGIAAPSPMNSQPWEFIVITRDSIKAQLCKDAESCKTYIVEKSQWKWLEQYSVALLKTVPVIIVVTGDKTKSGADIYSADGPCAYQHACAAAIQNMLLAAHTLGLGSLWYTLFDRQMVKDLLEIEENKIPLAFVCLGKPGKSAAKTPRKPLEKKARFID
ncbi:MAG: nitroreductase family protein [Desulfobacteraceae bacterium]|nr:MAG: nitroreductase family protein [Desulfobacteraceae bacterium]